MTRRVSEVPDIYTLITFNMRLQGGPHAETGRRCISGGMCEECMACLERLQQAAGNVWHHDHQLKVGNPLHIFDSAESEVHTRR